MIRIIGQVSQKERDRMARPGIVKPDHKETMTVPILRLRVICSTGTIIQILYKGDTPGDVHIGDQILVMGISRGGNVHTKRIYNLTTRSWVTPYPGVIKRFFNFFF